MIRWELLDKAIMPGDGGELRLMRRGFEYSIMSGPIELMNSRMSGSEQALATLAADRLKDRPEPSILIGGLGMGFTLRAALAAFGPDARIVVAELVPAVVTWARGPMAELFGACLDDPKVELAMGDVAAMIHAPGLLYDAILLDVDNGPEGMTQAANDGLYSTRGLKAAWTALRPGGVLAVWSQGPDAAFAQRFERAGFVVEEKRVRARGAQGGSRHIIWLGARGSR